MTQEQNQPLTPADCDLREFPFMPLDVVRLRDSDISAVSSGDEFRCAVLLWCASWHQVPAASLPDDDIILAQLAGFGRVVKEWKKVRAGSLRGWVKCVDGRLYHPVVAEKANEAWSRKQERAHEKECGRIKKLNQRHGTNIPFPTIEQFLSPDYEPPKVSNVPDVSPGTNSECPQGQKPNVPDVSPGKSRRQGDGQGQGQGQGQYVNPISVAAASEPETVEPELPTPAAASDAILSRAIELTGMLRKRGAALQASDPRVRTWAERGITDAQILTAMERANERRQERADHRPINAGLLDAILGDIVTAPNRQSPANSRDQQRQEAIDVLTGRSRSHERTNSEERDITGECQRVA